MPGVPLPGLDVISNSIRQAAMQITEAIRSEIGPGEQVLWSGQPRAGIVLRASDAFAIPFGVLWTSFAVEWLVGARQANAPWVFTLVGIPFILVGVYMTVGRFLVEARQRGATSYAVTSQRIIIASGLFGKKVKSLDLRTLSELTLSVRPGGTGTITFGGTHADGSLFRGRPGWPGAGQQRSPCFDQVSQAREVCELIRKAQAAAQ